MPELPEVETTCRSIAPLMQGQPLLGIVVLRERLRFPVPTDLPDVCRHAVVQNIHRRAKYILFTLNNNKTILLHLGMSGRLCHKPAIEPYAPHDRIVFELPAGQQIRLHDPRCFSLVLLEDTRTVYQHRLLKDLGPEPLEETFQPAYLHSICQKRTAPIKTVLMDQAVVVGVGNIYANEALFRARIHPTTPANTLTERDCLNLIMAITAVLSEALSAGGTTLRDYMQIDGKLGYFHESFSVYGRDNQKCLAKNCPGIIQRIVLGQRSTFFCPHCQSTPTDKTTDNTIAS